MENTKPNFDINTMNREGMITHRGGIAKDQFTYTGNGYSVFVSYGSIVAATDSTGQVFLDPRYWDYSATTGRYRNQFLDEGIAETRKNIESGKYILVNLS